MYAIIEACGRQLKVAEGETLNIDLVDGKEGDKIVFDRVLMIGGLDKDPKIGVPYVQGAKVEATLKGHLKGPKVLVFKYRRRKNYKRTRGHRQPFTSITIQKIHA